MASDSVWDSLKASFQDALQEDKTVNTPLFCDACEQIAVLYDALFSIGMVAGQLKSDITNSAQTVRKCHLKNPTKTATVQDLLKYDISTVGLEKVRYDKKSGTLGLLWAKRAVEFIAMYLRLIATRPDLTSGQCAKETYETVLRRYHGWMTSGLVKTGLGMAPERIDIYTKMGLGKDKKVAEGLLLEMAEVLDGVVSSVQGALEANGADFPDTV